MTRTPTLPLDDKGMWRRILGRAHPDGGGTHELFIWASAVRDAVCGNSAKTASAYRFSEDRSYEEPPRVPLDPAVDFSELTRRALAMAEETGGVYGALLEMLSDCEAPPMQTGAWEQRGASYKKLAAVGHMVGMSKAERGRWYRIAEAVPLSDRHVGHLLGRLKRRAA